MEGPDIYSSVENGECNGESVIENEVTWEVTEEPEDFVIRADAEDDNDIVWKNRESEIQDVKMEISKESRYSKEVTDYISSIDELKIYQEAGLTEQEIDGRKCLVRQEIDLSYIDINSGFTNAELIKKGRSPYDAKTGERIELHHIGQDFNAPLAELTSVSEHDVYSKVLHKQDVDSWRRDPEKVSLYNKQRASHWKNRA